MAETQAILTSALDTTVPGLKVRIVGATDAPIVAHAPVDEQTIWTNAFDPVTGYLRIVQVGV